MVSKISDLPMSQFLVNKQFRLLNCIRSRINALEFQKKYSNEKSYPATRPATYYVPINTDLAILKKLKARLVINSFIDNTVYSEVLCEFNKFPKKVEDHVRNVLGFYVPKKLNLRRELYALKEQVKHCQPDEVQALMAKIGKEEFDVEVTEKCLENMKMMCLKSRKQEILSRAILEARVRGKDGWFMVFNTLTADDRYIQEVFGENSTAWRDYVRSVDRAIGIRLFGTWRNALRERAKGAEFHTYISVVERGADTGRPHFHVIHFMKALPEGCVDPNMGRDAFPYRDEIDAFKEFWKFGWSTPKPVRCDGSDPYAKLHWIWPLTKNKDTGKYEVLLSKPPEAVVNYITKYLTKEFEKCPKKNEVRWRTKMSRSLGQRICQMVVENCNDLQLEMILRMRSKRVLLIRNRSMPLWMMKKMAMKKLLMRKKIQTPMKLWSMMLGLAPREGFLKRLRCMIRRKENPKPVSYGDLRMLTLMRRVGSKLVDICQKISDCEFGVMLPTIEIRGSSKEVRFG